MKTKYSQHTNTPACSAFGLDAEKGAGERRREGQGPDLDGAAGHAHAQLGSKLSLQRDICSITPMHCG